MKKQILGRSIAAALFFCLFLSVVPVRAEGYSYGGDIRIGLTNMAGTSIKVTLSGGYKMGDTAVKSGTSFDIELNSGKIIMSGKEYDEITLVPENRGNLIKLRVSSAASGNTYVKEYSYRGTISFRASNGSILPINTIDIEDYLMGVVPYEMSNIYPIEALKAQAVAARSYAVANLGKHGSLGYDLDDTTHCQVYRGYNSNYGNAIRSVEETQGMVLLYNGKVIATYFYSSNGGYTEACQNVWFQTIPYLKSKPDIYDNDDSSAWTRTFTKAEVEALIKSKKYIGVSDSFVRLNLDNMTTYESGRISRLDIVYKPQGGEEKIKTLTKEAARTFLDLRSSLYTLSFEDEKYVFRGRGYGHGLGLSQIGASSRAKAGQSFQEILAFYYEGTSLATRQEGIKSLEVSGGKALVGQEASINVNPVMGRSALYKYIIKKDDKIVKTIDFSSESQLKYSAGEAGDYVFEVYIKDKLSKQEYDDMKTAGISFFNAPKVKDLAINPAKAYLNKPLEVKGISDGGSSEGVEYKIEILYGGTIVDSKTGSASTGFTPAQEGQYEVRFYVKDKLSSREYDDLRSMKFTVEKEFVPPTGSDILFTFTRELKRGMSGNDVKQLQEALKSLGHFSSSVTTTTYFGPISEFALKSFQANLGMVSTGKLDSKSAEKLNQELVKLKLQSSPENKPADKAPLPINRTLKLGIIGEDVKQLQQALRDLGYFKYGSTTTYFGSLTRSAVMEFQRNNGLVVDGIVGSKTLAKLNSLIK